MKKGMKSAFAATLALTACFGGISAMPGRYFMVGTKYKF